jgi:23S rRNA pseudouridine1911/1915/1917 synthase
MPATTHHIIATPEDGGQRADKFLSARLGELSRSRVQALLEEGHITCNGVAVDASSKVKAGQAFAVTIPEVTQSHIVAQEMALSIVFEDEHLLIINKPAGLTVHPAPGHPDMTLVNALLAHCGASLSGIGGVARPGIVHRIDKDTSGLLVVAKHDPAHHHLSEQLSTRTLGRTYAALVWGVPQRKNGTITGNIGRSPNNRQKMAVVKTGGKEATTHYSVLESFYDKLALIECRLETGRTHQIRVHCTHLGHPLVGDATYGQSTKSRLTGGGYKHLPEAARTALLGFERQALHARELHLIHPETKKEMSFSCPLPEDMQALISVLQ